MLITKDLCHFLKCTWLPPANRSCMYVFIVLDSYRHTRVFVSKPTVCKIFVGYWRNHGNVDWHLSADVCGSTRANGFVVLHDFEED